VRALVLMYAVPTSSRSRSALVSRRPVRAALRTAPHAGRQCV